MRGWRGCALHQRLPSRCGGACRWLWRLWQWFATAQSLFVFAHVLKRQLHVVVGRRTGLLDEAMQQDHPLFPVHVEKNPRNSIRRQVRPHFLQAVAQWAAGWHSAGPANFDGANVLTNQPAIVPGQVFEPFPDEFASRLSTIQDGLNALQLFVEQCTTGGTRRRVFVSIRPAAQGFSARPIVPQRLYMAQLSGRLRERAVRAIGY